VVLLCSFSTAANADYLFTPFLGGAFAGRTSFLDLEQGARATQFVFGGSVGWLSAGVLGVEGEFTYGPRFFERNNAGGIILSSDALTLSGSVLLAAPLSVTEYSLRPYLVGGVGLIHSGITYNQDFVVEPVDDNSLGLNVGGGALGFVTRNTGVRFELRHFRTFGRAANLADPRETSARLSFWRFTFGVVIRR
jgi:hypothetical protein